MDYETEGQNDTRYMGGRIAGFSDNSVSKCAEECFRKANCESINFNFDAMKCDLLKSSSESAVVAEGWTYFKSIDWIQFISESCTRDTCTGNAKCLDLSGGGHYCLLSHCDRPKDIPGAKLSSEVYDDFRHGKTIRYSCEPSAWKAGNAEITCQNNGTWIWTDFECRCGDPISVPGLSIGYGRSVGTSYTYTCCDPLKTGGNQTTSTCQSNGEWSKTDVYCECNNDPSEKDGTYFTTKGGHGVGDTWYLTCIDDYDPDCDHNDYYSWCNKYTICLESGKWSYTEFTCTKKQEPDT